MKTRKMYITAIAALIIAFTCLCVFAGCETINNVKDKIETVDDVFVFDENGNSLASGEVYEMPKTIAFSGLKAAGSTRATSKAVRLTASVYPSTARDKEVSWDIEWVYPQSAFATGKNVQDYVSLTVVDDTGLVVDVTGLAAFGTQIKISVSLVSMPDIKSECTVDCLQQIESFRRIYKEKAESSSSVVNTFVFEPNGEINFAFYGVNGARVYDSEGYVTVENDIVSSEPYTISDFVKFSKFYIKQSPYLKSELAKTEMSSNNLNLISSGTDWIQVTNTTSTAGTYQSYKNGSITSCVDIMHALTSGIIFLDNSELGRYNQANYFYTALSNIGGAHFSVKFEIEFEFNGIREFVYDMRFTDASIGITATALSLSQSNILM